MVVLYYSCVLGRFLFLDFGISLPCFSLVVVGDKCTTQLIHKMTHVSYYLSGVTFIPPWSVHISLNLSILG